MSKATKAGGDAKTRATTSGVLKFPGKPNKIVPPIVFKKFRIYTDLKHMSWRVQKHGDKKDKKASFKVDAKDTWGRVCDLVGAKAGAKS